ncbi:hypothetical protein HDU76_002553 [Blyttiomyces sp. JEL0837]|nr:hypothetical protein HDU76_002553 [Blyttiomyces sp. JEL0837]
MTFAIANAPTSPIIPEPDPSNIQIIVDQIKIAFQQGFVEGQIDELKPAPPFEVTIEMVHVNPAQGHVIVVIPILAKSLHDLMDLRTTLDSISAQWQVEGCAEAEIVRFEDLNIDANDPLSERKHSPRQSPRASPSTESQTTTPLSVIVVDDGSSAYSHDIYVICSKSSLRMTLLRSHENRGAAAARNRALDFIKDHSASFGLSDSSRVAFVDTGIIVGNGWVQKVISNPEKYKGDKIIAGVTLPTSSSRYAEFHIACGTLMPRLMVEDLNLEYLQLKKGDILYAPTCNLLIQGQRLIQQLRFNEEFTKSGFEDVEFCLRARLVYQVELVLDVDLLVFHDFHEMNLDMLKGRFRRYGFWGGLLIRKFPEYLEVFKKTGVPSCPVEWEE